MKKLLFVFILFCVSLLSEAQQFLRYHMNNNTYNGFYTENIDSIIHRNKAGKEYAFVHTLDSVYVISTSEIDSIAIEGANLEDNNIGEYRIYEINCDEEDIRKVFVDNRASLFASHNGDFGANDTILFSSAYNDIKLLIYTDNQGSIKKIFDGERLLFFDYDSESEVNILDIAADTTYHYKQKTSNSVNKFKASLSSLFSTFCNQIQRACGAIQEMSRLASNSRHYRIAQHTQQALSFAKNIDLLQNDPEFHNQKLLIDASGIVLDIPGVIAAAGAAILTEGAAAANFGIAVGILYNDIVQYMIDMWPESEQMQKYQDYYKKKYSILFSALPAKYISYTSATLCGHMTTEERMPGTFSFKLYGDDIQTLLGNKRMVGENYYLSEVNANNLKPGWPYFYNVQYTCVVDGLTLIFNSDNITEFRTLAPYVFTGEVQSISKDRAQIVCSYYDVPDGAICGVEYSWNDGKEKKHSKSTRDGEHYYTLSQLNPNTTYTYQAFVIIDGNYVYSEEKKQFTTEEDYETEDLNIFFRTDAYTPYETANLISFQGYSDPPNLEEYFADFSVPNKFCLWEMSQIYIYFDFPDIEDDNYEDYQRFWKDYKENPDEYQFKCLYGLSEDELIENNQASVGTFYVSEPHPYFACFYLRDLEPGEYICKVEIKIHDKHYAKNTKFTIYGPTKEEYVDLGLSVKWASKNYKADKATDNGEFFESVPEGLRVPSIPEIDELISKCEIRLGQVNGVTGMLFTGGNGNSVFIPYAGRKINMPWTDTNDGEGNTAYFWTNHSTSKSSRYYCEINNRHVKVDYVHYWGSTSNRYFLPIRMVK